MLLVELTSNFGLAMLRAFVSKPQPVVAAAPPVAASDPAPAEPVIEAPVAEAPEPPAGRGTGAGADRGAAAERRQAGADAATSIASSTIAWSATSRRCRLASGCMFGTLYDGYCAHCRRHGVEPMATNQLGAALKRSGVEHSRKRGGATYYTRKALAEVAQKRPRRHGAASGPLPGDIDVGRSCVDGLHNPRPVH